MVKTRPVRPSLSSLRTGSSTLSRHSISTDAAATSSCTESLPTDTSYSVSTPSDGFNYKLDPKPPQEMSPAMSHSPAAMTIPKVRSSSHGAISASRSAFVHGKLHRRGNSTSSVQSPDATSANHHDMDSFPYASDDHDGPDHFPNTTLKPTSTTKIKPLLRKLAPRERSSLDLSRSAADNEALPGLGIYGSDMGVPTQSAADVNFSHAVPRGGYHQRSSSGTSQFSSQTASSARRPSGQYIHPMRQTPRPYTPSLGHSHSTSIMSSEPPEEEADVIYETAAPRRSLSIGGSAPVQRPPLRVQTSMNSVPRIGHGSQTSLLNSPYSIRARTDTLRSVDTASPSTRSSLDRGFRIRTREPLDPASRAASIRAARQAFSEKEEAKARKAEEDEYKAACREHRKREKQEEGERRKSESREFRARRTSSSLNEKIDSLPGREFAGLTPVQSRDIPPPTPNVYVDAAGPASNITTKRAIKSKWMGFWTWLRTRVFKIGRKVSHAV
ncbi:hypothetical protein L228DRAFT_268475 [Xylona heveae TC161]|uniref:Uncharacterized protein n=1 Tax=Xylona heveae (strain CBS 132557 / TC161) TaxID=1328760 RepID=A0A165GB23_XYLHT|nr:hypothetical protein L228DRAFT_268475 [Xylona heveae TC161]KZF21969.1 hypothetical protein L228DRAFT_268475 [Xylona heveae TC161]